MGRGGVREGFMGPYETWECLKGFIGLVGQQRGTVYGGGLGGPWGSSRAVWGSIGGIHRGFHRICGFHGGLP